MAKKAIRSRNTRSDARRKKQPPLARRIALYTLATIVLATILYASWLWWDMRSWRPDEASYPEQGAVIRSGPEQLRFSALSAIGAKFVYLRLEDSSRAEEDDFASRIERASGTQLKIGVLLPFNPCLPADPQSTYFTQMVARNADLLPPAIELNLAEAECASKVSDAAIESEVMTLINQVELHAGKPVVLKVSRDFEERYKIANTVERDLWLERDRAKPNYAGRPWLLWSANSQLISEAAEEPIEWVVIQK